MTTMIREMEVANPSTLPNGHGPEDIRDMLRLHYQEGRPKTRILSRTNFYGAILRSAGLLLVLVLFWFINDIHIIEWVVGFALGVPRRANLTPVWG